MRILWSIHLYPPKHNCGAEYVAHHINKWLLAQGHEVRVMLLQHQSGPYTWDGVDVVPACTDLDAYAWADVIITHLDFTRHTINIARLVKRPVVHFMHNDSWEAYTSIRDAMMPQYMVFNSFWMQQEYNKHGFDDVEQMVIQPPCPAEFYRILGNPVNNQYITLMNVNENKGGYQFARIATALPEKQFLAVKGSYDDGGLQPDILKVLAKLPNVRIVDHTSNVREIYQQTRLLLVLSRYESWGRVATEAMSNGIPVIYTRTPGLSENVANAGWNLAPRGERVLDDKTNQIRWHDGETYDIDEVVAVIKSFDNAEMYSKWSEAGLKRYKTFQSNQYVQLQQFGEFLQGAKQKFADIRNAVRTQ